MLLIQPVFYKNQHRIKNNLNNKRNNIYSNNPSSFGAEFPKACTDTYKANYMMNFKGEINYEKSNSSGIGTLNHQTAFFREPKTDEIVQNYILDNFYDEEKINIVSGACSTGEEAKSYAMMLDFLKDKLNIMGFDISTKIVEAAQGNSSQLIIHDKNSPMHSSKLNSENMLLTNTDDLAEYQKKCKDKFKQYYKPKGTSYRIPVFPNARQELRDLKALLTNEEEFKIQRMQYYKRIHAIKNLAPELAQYMTDIGFEKAIKKSIRLLEKQSKAYCNVINVEARENSFDNCTFSVGDIKNLEQLYKPNSINVLLYRNALYHTLCAGDNIFRYMKEDAAETMDLISKQMNKILKTQGLVVFGEKEGAQNIDKSIIKQVMENNGFKILEINGKPAGDNIWVKVEDIKA